MAMMVPMATDEEHALGQCISRNLQALLRARGLNQGQLAYKSGLSTSNVSNLVNGRKNPSFYSVAKAALALDVDPLELAGFRPLQIPENAVPETASDPQLVARMSKYESDLQNMRRDFRQEMLELAKTQKTILDHLQAEQSVPRRRSKLG